MVFKAVLNKNGKLISLSEPSENNGFKDIIALTERIL